MVHVINSEFLGRNLWPIALTASGAVATLYILQAKTAFIKPALLISSRQQRQNRRLINYFCVGVVVQCEKRTTYQFEFMSEEEKIPFPQQSTISFIVVGEPTLRIQTIFLNFIKCGFFLYTFKYAYNARPSCVNHLAYLTKTFKLVIPFNFQYLSLILLL